MLLWAFFSKTLPVEYMKKADYSKKISKSRWNSTFAREQAISQPILFYLQLCFIALEFLKGCMWKKLVLTLNHNNCGMFASGSVQLLMTAWKACTRALVLESI